VENSVLASYSIDGFTQDEENARLAKSIKDLIVDARGPDRSKWGVMNIQSLWLEWWNEEIPSLNEQAPIGGDTYKMDDYCDRILDSVSGDSDDVYIGGGNQHPPAYLARVLSYSSVQALDTLQKSVLQRQSRITGLHGLYRVIKKLGVGAYGIVLGMTMRDGELDMKILDELNSVIVTDKKTNKVSTDSGKLISGLQKLFSNVPKNLAVKVSLRKVDSVNEFLIGRYLASWTLGRGHHCIPAYYSIFKHAGPVEQQVDVYSSSTSLPRLVDPALIVGRTLNVGTPSYYLYQEYLNGSTLDSMISGDRLSIQEMNAIVCYLHGILSYLYNQIGFVHCDLHRNNIFLILVPGGITLPILNEDGDVITYIRLRYQPMMIDFGTAKVNALCPTRDLSLYNTSQIQDIMYIHRVVNGDGDDIYSSKKVPKEKIVGYNVTKQFLARDMNFDTALFVPAYLEYLAEGTLTHARIVQDTLASGVLDSIKTNPPAPTIRTQMGLYTGRDDVSRAELTAKAEDLYWKYSMMDLNDVNTAVVAYLNETKDYYRTN
jgi:serine/threonine protein kinase